MAASGKIHVVWLALLCLSCTRAQKGQEEGTKTSKQTPAISRTDTERGPIKKPERRGLATLARLGFDGAVSTGPRIEVGATLSRLRLTRPTRTQEEMERRLSGVLAAMQRKLSPQQVRSSAWSLVPDEGGNPSELQLNEPAPGLVVSYDAALDDLSIVDTALAMSSVGVDTDDIPWPIYNDVVETLGRHGVVDPRFTLDDAETAFVRSGVRGPGGKGEQWVDEILFETNVRVGAVPVLDAGLRVGITPTGAVSSLRVTGVDIEPAGTMKVRASLSGVRDAFARHIDSSRGPIASVSVLRHSVAYVLDPDVVSAIVDPRYAISYSTTYAKGETRVSSRTTMVLFRMTDAQPSLALRFPGQPKPAPAPEPSR